MEAWRGWGGLGGRERERLEGERADVCLLAVKEKVLWLNGN